MYRLRSALLLIGVVLVAYLAFAPGAGAEGEPAIFTLGKTTSTPKQTQSEIVAGQTGEAAINYLELLGNKMSCEAIEYGGEEDDGTARELTVVPKSFEGCESEGLAATVDPTGCDFRLYPPTTIDKGAAYTGDLGLACPEGESIEISIFAGEVHSFVICRLDVVPFEVKSHVAYKATKNGMTHALRLEVEADELPYTVTGFCGGAEKEDGIFKSQIEMVNKLGKASHDIWLEH